jgi:ABC-type Fe3+-hydroxamate transport system substrate-binding protein
MLRTLVLTAALLPFQALAEPVSVTDQNGHTLTFETPPSRVVCLLNRCAQELAFVGGPVPMGFGAPYTWNVANDPANFGAAAAGAAKIDQVDGIDFEAVAALAPDLVIGEPEHIAPLQGIAPVYTLNWDPKTDVDAFLHDVRAYARLFGREAATEARIDAVLDRVAAYAALSPRDRTVAVIFVDPAGDTLHLPPDCGLFLSQAALCVRDEPGDWVQIGVEGLLFYDPDVLIVEDYGVGDDAALTALSAHPLWAELSAVKGDAVHLVPVSAARANTIHSVAQVMDRILPLLHPATFPTPLTDDEIAAALVQE